MESERRRMGRMGRMGNAQYTSERRIGDRERRDTETERKTGRIDDDDSNDNDNDNDMKPGERQARRADRDRGMRD